MSDSVKIDKARLRLLYIEILKGFSTINNKELGKFYIKHFSCLDSGEFDLKYEDFLNKAKEDGLPTIEEKLQDLEKTGLWTKNNDLNLLEYKKYIDTLKLTKSKLFKEHEVNRVNDSIKEYEGKVRAIEEEKKILTEYTAENWAARKLNEFYIFNAFYKDPTLKDNLFNAEEFDSLNDKDILLLMETYNKITSDLNIENIDKICLLPIFLNLLSLSETCLDFFGQPLYKLTFYQAELYNRGKYFRSIFSQSKSSPPPELLDDPAGLIDWFNGVQTTQRMIEEGKTPETMVGLSEKDRERMGIKNEVNVHTRMAEAAMKKGGELNMFEMIDLIGENKNQ